MENLPRVFACFYLAFIGTNALTAVMHLMMGNAGEFISDIGFLVLNILILRMNPMIGDEAKAVLSTVKEKYFKK